MMATADEVQMEENKSAQRTRHFRDREFWNNRAKSFAGYAVQTHYADGFLKFIDIKPEWTVFDMACANLFVTCRM